MTVDFFSPFRRACSRRSRRRARSEAVATLFAGSVLLALTITVATPRSVIAEPDEMAASSDPDLLPHVVLSESAYDFGSVRSGTPVEHRFVLQNTGKGVLKILKMFTSCGCTAAVLDADTVAPGATTVVKATFDTTGFQGPKMKMVRLYTNDPKQASFTLTLQGSVQPDVQVSAMRIRFGDVIRGQTPQQAITATVDPASPVKIVDVVSRSPFLAIKASDVTLNGRLGKQVLVSLRPDAPVGVFRERISLKTSSAENPVINVPVLANVQGDLQLEPSILSFGVLAGPLRNPLYRDVQIRSRTGKAVRLAEVQSDNSSVKAHVLQDGGKTVIRVTVGADLQGAFRARLTITPELTTQEATQEGGSNTASSNSADAEKRQINLPVFGIVSSPTGPQLTEAPPVKQG